MGVEGPPSAAGRAPGLLRRWAFEGRESKGSREVGIQAQRPEENVAEGLGGGSNMADSCGREWGSRRRRLCGCLRTGSLRREWLKKQQPFSLLSLKGRRVETNRPGSRGWVGGRCQVGRKEIPRCPEMPAWCLLDPGRKRYFVGQTFIPQDGLGRLGSGDGGPIL